MASTEFEAARPTAIQSAGQKEIGRSPNYGIYGWGGDEILFPMLSGRELLVQMEIMAESDDTVGSAMFSMWSSISQVPFKHVAQIDGSDNDKDPKAREAAAFADTLLIDMKESFSDHLDNALRMIVMGTAPCEIVTKQRIGGTTSRFNDKYWGIKSLPPRSALSISQWVYSDDGKELIGMQQMAMPGSDPFIPIEKLLHYRTTASMENPWGRPLFKNAYKAWRYKNKMQEIEALGAERELVGLPVFEMPDEVIEEAGEVDANGAPTPAAIKAQSKIQAAISAVRDTRLNKSGGLILPSDTYADEGNGDRTRKYNFRLVTTGGQRSIDIRQPIRDYDRAIARVVMQQFLQLGDRSTGSYGLSEDQSGMGVKALMALMGKICDEWRTALVYVWRSNGFDMRFLPRLGYSQLTKEGLQQLGAFLSGLGRTAGLWETDVEARMGISKLLNLPFNRDAQEAAANTAKKAAKMKAEPQQPQLPFGGQAGDGNQGNDDDEDVDQGAGQNRPN